MVDEYESMSDKDIELYIETCNKKTKKGRNFYICENNPKSCNYISWNKPKVGEKWKSPDK